jgi:hypothetical protein
VACSLSGLQRASNVSIEATKTAVETLQAPDPDSRTPDNDGRRIEKVDGGWLILNYKAYREKQHDEHRRNYMRDLMRRKREEDQLEAANKVLTGANNVLTPANPYAYAYSGVVPEGGDARGGDDPLTYQPPPPRPPLPPVADELPPLTPEQQKSAAKLQAHVMMRFGLAPLDINRNRIQAQIVELLMRGYAPEQIEEVADWAKSPKAGKGTPQSAVSATDPMRFSQWLTTLECHHKEIEAERKRRNR